MRHASRNSSIRINEPTNTIIVTDSESNIRRLPSILAALEGALSPALTALASAYALPLTPSASAASAFLSLLALALALAFLGALLAGFWVLRRFERGLEQTS